MNEQQPEMTNDAAEQNAPAINGIAEHLPKVVIVGRMNVGKSTLFNRLTETESAITSSWAGTTRDVKRGVVHWRGYELGLYDTGGLDVEDDEQLEERVIAAAHDAMEHADIILFVVDGGAGVLPQDKRLAEELRHSNVPVILVANKMDNPATPLSSDLYGLNYDETYRVSAINGSGSGDLLDAVYDHLDMKQARGVEERRTKVAIVGRPNVGKSSLINAILGEERVIVADKAHTTRDSNDIAYDYNGHQFTLIDTAGIRKRKNVGRRWGDARLGAIEKHSVRGSLAAIRRSDVVLLVLETQRRVTAQDKKIAELAVEMGKGLIIVMNKWDLIEEKDSNTINEFIDYFDQALPFMRWAPMTFISATERLRVRETLDVVLRVSENYNRELTLEDLEPVLEVAKRNYRPKQSATRKYRRKIARIMRVRQIGTRPPRFYLKTDFPKEIPPALPKIIEREIRERFDFDGVKMIIEIGK